MVQQKSSLFHQSHMTYMKQNVLLCKNYWQLNPTVKATPQAQLISITLYAFQEQRKTLGPYAC